MCVLCGSNLIPSDIQQAGNVWDYQWCTQMLPEETYFTFNGETDMFWQHPFNMSFINQHCTAKVGNGGFSCDVCDVLLCVCVSTASRRGLSGSAPHTVRCRSWQGAHQILVRIRRRRLCRCCLVILMQLCHSVYQRRLRPLVNRGCDDYPVPFPPRYPYPWQRTPLGLVLDKSR